MFGDNFRKLLAKKMQLFDLDNEKYTVNNHKAPKDRQLKPRQGSFITL